MKSSSGSPKPILIPVTLIAGAIVAMVILMWLMSRSSVTSRSFDFHLFDTYFVVGWSLLAIPLFLLITFILFFTRKIVA